MYSSMTLQINTFPQKTELFTHMTVKWLLTPIFIVTRSRICFWLDKCFQDLIQKMKVLICQHSLADVEGQQMLLFFPELEGEKLSPVLLSSMLCLSFGIQI